MEGGDPAAAGQPGTALIGRPPDEGTSPCLFARDGTPLLHISGPPFAATTAGLGPRV